jgi:hypothetical protein
MHNMHPAIAAYRKAYRSELYRARPWLADDVKAAFRDCAQRATDAVVLAHSLLSDEEGLEAHRVIAEYRAFSAGQVDLELTLRSVA